MNRKFLIFFTALLLPHAAIAAEAGPEITLSYSWAGIRGCSQFGTSPTFIIQNFPSSVRRIRLVLTQGNLERGGQEIDFPRSGIIPSGLIDTYGPCSEDMYRWTATLKDASGRVVGETHTNRFFPELASSGKPAAPGNKKPR